MYEYLSSICGSILRVQIRLFSHTKMSVSPYDGCGVNRYKYIYIHLNVWVVSWLVAWSFFQRSTLLIRCLSLKMSGQVNSKLSLKGLENSVTIKATKNMVNRRQYNMNNLENNITFFQHKGATTRDLPLPPLCSVVCFAALITRPSLPND